jgi:hypothetical protein
VDRYADKRPAHVYLRPGMHAIICPGQRPEILPAGEFCLARVSSSRPPSRTCRRTRLSQIRFTLPDGARCSNCPASSAPARRGRIGRGCRRWQAPSPRHRRRRRHWRGEYLVGAASASGGQAQVEQHAGELVAGDSDGPQLLVRPYGCLFAYVAGTENLGGIGVDAPRLAVVRRW